jgi:hypothetical protein
MFYRSSDNLLHYTHQLPDGETAAWTDIPGGAKTTTRPAATAYSNDHLVDVAIRNADGKIHWTELNATTGQWNSGWDVVADSSPLPSANNTSSAPCLWHEVILPAVDASVFKFEAPTTLLIRSSSTTPHKMARQLLQSPVEGCARPHSRGVAPKVRPFPFWPGPVYGTSIPPGLPPNFHPTAIRVSACFTVRRGWSNMPRCSLALSRSIAHESSCRRCRQA